MLMIGCFSGRDVGLGEDFVDVVDELGEGLGFAVSGLGHLDQEVGADVAGIAAEHDDAIGEQDGFFNVVGDQEDGLGGHGLVGPELEQFRAEVLGGEHVEGAEGLVHEENLRLDDEGAGKADALLHAAGELLGVSSFKAVEADGVKHLHAAGAALDGVDAASLKRGLDIFKDREPGEEREALKDNGDVDLGVGDGLFMPIDMARGGDGEAGEHAQHGGLAGAGGAEEGDDLSGDDGERGGGDDLDAVLAGLGVVLLDFFGADDGLDGRGGRGDGGRFEGFAGDGRFLHGELSVAVRGGCRGRSLLPVYDELVAGR